MAVLRGQIYQFNLNPLIFFSIQRIYSANQILIMNVDTHASTYFTEARLLSTCTLVDAVPENRVHNGYDRSIGEVSVSNAYALTENYLSATVETTNRSEGLVG